MRKGVGREVEGESGNVIDACLCGFGRDGSIKMVI